MRTNVFGCTPPWQLLEAQEPGPLYLPASPGVAAGCCCGCGVSRGFTCAIDNRFRANKQLKTKDGRNDVARMAITLRRCWPAACTRADRRRNTLHQISNFSTASDNLLFI